jgi:hypothetical protein
MDIVFSNRISTAIHKRCVTKLIEDGEYTTETLKFRGKVEDCFTDILLQQQYIMAGIS